MQLELQKSPIVDAPRRRALGLSLVLHLFLLAFFLVNPDFLSTTPRRVVVVTGEDYDLDRFEVVELYLPPDPEVALPPQIAEALLPPEAEPPRAREEAAEEAAPPELPPVPPPPVIGPDDLIAEGARPDAPSDPPDPAEAAETAGIGARAGPDSGESPGSDGEGGREAPDLGSPPVLAPPGQEPAPPVAVARNTDPNALIVPNLRRQAEAIIEELLAQGALSGANAGRDDGLPGTPNLTTEQPTILSDTRGYDFGPYMNQVINRVRRNWYALIPEAARIGSQRGRVVIVFTITESGRVEGLRAVLDSGAVALDRAAAAAIQASNPFPVLPDDFDGDRLVLQFTFLYNMTD
jgi:TonB family protein